MPSGTWAFLQESVIYEYMMYRFHQNQLRIRQAINNGVPELKEKWVKISYLNDITDTFFPDIKHFKIQGDIKGERPAEIKYQTSLFKYHKSKDHQKQYVDFIHKNGCIVVLKHDYLPEDLEEYDVIDVYELDLTDFIGFTKENFDRFLNRQIKSHEFSKVWLMSQSKNFYETDGHILPAYKSGRWCPSDNLSGFDLSVNDKVVFLKTKGASKQNVVKHWSRYREIYSEWILDELYITRVVAPIKSRHEYYKYKNIPAGNPLWYDETDKGKKDKRVIQRKNQELRWKRVFEFETTLHLASLNLRLKDLNKIFPVFVQAVREIYTFPVSREIEIDLYTSVIEYLSVQENSKRLGANEYIQFVNPYEAPHSPVYS